jgi:hypothetical protein
MYLLTYDSVVSPAQPWLLSVHKQTTYLFRGCVCMTGSVAESVRVDSINRVFDWSMLLGTKSMEDPGVRELGIISGGELRDVRGDSSMRGKLTKGEVVYATVEADATGSVPARFTSCNRFLKAGVKRTGVCNGLGIMVLCLAETRLRFCLKSIINPLAMGLQF